MSIKEGFYIIYHSYAFKSMYYPLLPFIITAKTTSFGGGYV